MRLRGITRNVVMLGLVSFFTDLSSEMLYPIIPLFIVGSLGASPALLGLIEGLAEGISSGLRWIGGIWSDRSGRRKPFVISGYAFSALSKPIMGLAAYALGWPLFLIGRCGDRFGKALRTAARDALIADSTDPAHRGAAFGFHRGADTCGAVLGPLIALGILTVRPDLPLAWFFFIALLPGAASVLIALLGVREIRLDPTSGAGDGESDAKNMKDTLSAGASNSILVEAVRAEARPPLPRSFWIVLAAFAVFSLGNSSDSFLILRSKELGLSFRQVLLAFMLFNAVYVVAALPLGKLSDRIGRIPVIVAGWLGYAGVYLGFAYFQSTAAPWALLAFYGLYQALTEGVMKALVTDVVPRDRRAGAIGLMAAVGGIGQLAASVLAGLLWHYRILDETLMLPFVLGAGCALAAIPIVAMSGARHKPSL